jgi:aminoglycoside phosphotransferase (APT) family kinase protein
LTFKVCDDSSSWVVRRPPLSGLTPSAHDVVSEYRVTQALQSTRIPVPATVACDRDGNAMGVPLSVFSFVPGLVVRDRDHLSALTDAQVKATVAALVQTLADLHSIDPGSVGLDNFGRPNGFLSRQIKLWTRQWEHVKTRELADVATLSAALSATIPPRLTRQSSTETFGSTTPSSIPPHRTTYERSSTGSYPPSGTRSPIWP